MAHLCLKDESDIVQLLPHLPVGICRMLLDLAIRFAAGPTSTLLLASVC